jgi:Zn-dependent protease
MKLTTAFGIPIRIHWSFLVLLGGYALWSMGSGLSAFATSLALSVGLFGSVVLHELGHALAARHYGIDTAHITLYPFGGVAAIRGMPRTPRHEFVIAIAGPAVNVALVGVGVVAFLATGLRPLAIFAVLNAVMAIFNMIPAFPMDGGRVLRAFLAGRMGWLPATELALKIGRGFAFAFLGIGLLSWSLNLLFIGGFLLFAIRAERERLMWVSSHGPRPDWTRGTRHPRASGGGFRTRPAP